MATKSFSRWKWNVVIFYSICLAGLIIFAKGFFPMKVLDKDVSQLKDVPLAPVNQETLIELIKEDFHSNKIFNEDPEMMSLSPYKKLVLIVIDAMRFDFITKPPYKSHMPFLHSVLNRGHGKLYVSKARAPTVTMPRIKAITTGSIPGYIDVVLNMDNSAELKDDNIITTFKRIGKKLVFYGDDTWLRLFPNCFARKDGTTSFFVTDYTEVDTNVTRHLDQELNMRKDWDVMILHYLGLDHIGHVVGPTSPLILSKLDEMDSVIKQVFSSIQKQEDALLLVTSDHGMSGQGSHGGTTPSEVETPLIFLSSNLKQAGVGTVPSVDQIDLAPTLSLLMGVPIPKSSMGQLIPGMFSEMGRPDELHSLQYNCHHLLQKLGASKKITYRAGSGPLHLYRNGLQFHAKYLSENDNSSYVAACENYRACQHEASLMLTSSLASYNYWNMSLGIGILCCGCCVVVSLWVQGLLRSKRSSIFNEQTKTFARAVTALTLGTFLHLATLPGSSFVEEEHQIWYFLTASTCIALVVAILRETANAAVPRHVAKETSSSLYDAQVNFTNNLRLRKGQKSWQVVTGKQNENAKELSKSAESPVKCDEDSLQEETHFKDHPIVKQTHIKSILVAFLLTISHRILRSWNQTGIKFADEPDIGDWLNLPSNKLCLSLVCIASLLVIFIMMELLCCTRDYLRSVACICGLCAVYLYRSNTGVVWSVGTNLGKNIGLYEARFVYSMVAFLVLKSIFHRLSELLRTPSHPKRALSSPPPSLCWKRTHGNKLLSTDCMQSSLVLLSVLLLRPHNHWVVTLNLIIYYSLFRLLWPVVVEGRVALLDKSLLELCTVGLHLTPLQAVLRIILAYWFGQNAYFSLGNSNSLATVDLSAAYVGLGGSEGLFNSFCAVTLSSFTTYIGPLLWTTLCLSDLIKHCSNGSEEQKHAKDKAHESTASLDLVVNSLAVLRLITVAVYVAVATGHRYHLFVWSVFSPKLLYELVNTCVQWWLLVVTILLW